MCNKFLSGVSFFSVRQNISYETAEKATVSQIWCHCTLHYAFQECGQVCVKVAGGDNLAEMT